MLFLHFLLTNTFAYPFPSTVINLNDTNFHDIIDRRANKSIFMVMYHGDHCPACRAAYPAFSEASRKGFGIVSFGHVDCSSNPIISYRFKIRAIPTFIVFHPGGESTFRSFKRTASSFLDGALSYLPDNSIPANASWIDFKNHPENNNISAIVYLTSRWSVPDDWKTLQFNFSTYPNITFGYANDRHTKKEFIEVIKSNQIDLDLQTELSNTKDVIFFINNGSVTKYQGKLTFRSLQSEIYRHFNLLRTVYEKPQEKVSTKLDFTAMCRNKQRYCVVDTIAFNTEKKNQNNFLSDALKNISKSEKYKKAPFRFLICGKTCPSVNMKSKRVYIFNKNKEEMIEINLEDYIKDNNQKEIERLVSENLDKVLANEAQWIPSVFTAAHKKSKEL